MISRPIKRQLIASLRAW